MTSNLVNNPEHNHLHFNQEAPIYNKRHEVGIKQLTEDLQAHQDWFGLDTSNGKQARVLDYACGTGLVSHALASFATQFIGIDLSENMVKEYNNRAQDEGIPVSKMVAYHGNLMKPSGEPSEFDDPQFFDFDMAAVGLGFHHIPDPPLASIRLARRLKSGGKLMIIDNYSPDHTGFSYENVKKMFEDAGVGMDFDYKVLERPLPLGRGHGGAEQRVFLAKGTKL